MPESDPYLPLLDVFAGQVASLRRAIQQALAEVIHERPLSSRLIASRLGLDKNLGWFCLRIATVEEVKPTLASLPGRRAWVKVFAGLRSAGCREATVEALKEAATALQTRLEEASIDREALRAILRSETDSPEVPFRHLRLRKRFFETSRLMWGVSAKGVVAAQMLAPSRVDAEAVDVAALQIVHGLERHQEGPPWTFYYACIAHDGAGDDSRHADRALGPGSAGALIEDLSSPGILDGEVRVGTYAYRNTPRELDVYEFVRTAPGRHGALRAVFGEIVRAAGGRHAEVPGEQVTLNYADTVPTATLVLDVLLHEDLIDLAPPTATLAATIDRNTAIQYRLRLEDQLRLPLGGPGPAPSELALPTPLASCSRTYRELVTRAAAALGSDASKFGVYRTIVPYPPIPSTVGLTMPLPVRSVTSPDKA